VALDSVSRDSPILDSQRRRFSFEVRAVGLDAGYVFQHRQGPEQGRPGRADLLYISDLSRDRAEKAPATFFQHPVEHRETKPRRKSTGFVSELDPAFSQAGFFPIELFGRAVFATTIIP
jgi:hypothetical protein